MQHAYKNRLNKKPNNKGVQIVLFNIITNTTEKLFKSVLSASKELNINRSKIYRSLKNNQIICDKYIFKYAKDPN